MSAVPENKTHYVVNCSGLGAGQLCRDEKVYPTRGAVLRVNKKQKEERIIYLCSSYRLKLLG